MRHLPTLLACACCWPSAGPAADNELTEKEKADGWVLLSTARRSTAG